MLTWKQLLFEIVGWEEPIFTKQVANHYQMPLGEAGRRLSVLHGWGYLRYADRGRRGRGGYVITEWAKKCVKRWSEQPEEESDGSDGEENGRDSGEH